jgi:hypothetical protein
MNVPHRVLTPPPPPSGTKSGSSSYPFNEQNIPLLPTGVGERYSQTKSNLCQAALLRRCELPL